MKLFDGRQKKIDEICLGCYRRRHQSSPASYYARLLNWVHANFTNMKRKRVDRFGNFLSLNNQKLINRIFGIVLLCCLLVMHNGANGQQMNLSDWKMESARKEMTPVGYIDKKTTFKSMPTAVLSGGGKQYADGHWYNSVSVEPGKYFAFETFFLASKVDEPGRSVLARIIWQNASGEVVGEPEYPATLLGKKQDGWNIIQQTYQVPEGATKAKIELQYRWDADGMVHFGGVSFQPTSAPLARVVRLASVHLRPVDSKSSHENLEKFAQLIAKAAGEKADIVCLPEGITLV